MTAIVDARAKLAAALAPTDVDVIDGRQISVLLDLVDALEPPALMLGWGEPWLDPMSQCHENARLVITCVAGRLVPGAGVATLEQLVTYTLARLRAQGVGAWPLDQVSGPRAFRVSQITYLAARVTVRAVVT